MQEQTDSRWKDHKAVAQFLAGPARTRPFLAEQAEILEHVLALAGRRIRRVADVGCGGGRIGRFVLDAFDDAHCVFADFSQPMLDSAREATADCADRAEFVRADYADPGWRDALAAHGPYDAIVTGLSIHHAEYDRKRSLYADIFTLLEPGGIFVNVEHVRSASPWLEDVHDRWFVRRTMDNGGFEDQTFDEALAGYKGRDDRANNLLVSVETQCDWLREIGYCDVDIAFKAFEQSVFLGRKPA